MKGPPHRTQGHRTGSNAVLWALEFLISAGCAVNSLESSDYGFDLLVQLPASTSPPDGASWAMSTSSVLVQVKGLGRGRAVALGAERWNWLGSTPGGAYIALWSPNPRNRWIGHVDSLVGVKAGSTGRVPQLPIQRPGAFLRDAHRSALLGSERARTWWLNIAPERSGCWAYDRAVLGFLVDIHVLDRARTTVFIDREQLAADVATSIEALPLAERDAVINLLDSVAGCGNFEDDVREYTLNRTDPLSGYIYLSEQVNGDYVGVLDATAAARDLAWLTVLRAAGVGISTLIAWAFDEPWELPSD